MKFDEINLRTKEGLLLSVVMGYLLCTKEYQGKTPDDVMEKAEAWIQKKLIEE